MHRSGKSLQFYFSAIAIIALLCIGSLTASDQLAAGYRDFSYPEDTGSNSRPTGEKPESKLWFNDGVWFGVLWSTPFNAYRIHKLDLTTQTWLDTGTVVDTRSKTRSDVLSDGTRLYIASHVYSGSGAPSTKSSDWGRLYRFTYNAGTKTYTLDSGFPVNVTGGKSETLVLAKDTTGTLWVTYVESNQVLVNRSLNGNDKTWGTPFALPGGALDNSEVVYNSDGTVTVKVTDDISTIVAYNGHVGILWSHQTYNVDSPNADPNFHSGGYWCGTGHFDAVKCAKDSRTAADADHLTSITMNFAVHDDGTDPSAWSHDEIYTASGDDHISLKAYDGHVYAAYKEAGLTKQIGLLDCDAAASGCRNKADWKHYPVYKRKDNNGNSVEAKALADTYANPTRPSLVIDTEHRDLYLFVSVEQGAAKQSSIRYKKASIDAINFPDDDGIPFITTDVLNNDPNSVINDPTSTKQNVSGTTGLVVLASDEVALHYFHNYLSLKP
jgi:hypothetical protein